MPSDHHHSVYVILLDDAVAKHPSVLRLNPNCDPSKPCVYVGMTGLPVEHRFENHKHGYKSAWTVPGLRNASNGHNFDWCEDPETMKWIRNEVRIRKGQRKRAAKHKARLSNAQRFSRVIGRMEKLVFAHLSPALKKPTRSELEKLGRAERRLKSIHDVVKLRTTGASAMGSW